MSPTPHDSDPALRAALAALGSADSPALRLGPVAAAELAARFGTPLYAFHGPALDRQLAQVQEALGPQVQVLYSIKANPSVAIVRRLRERGAWAEIASLGELQVARAAGLAAAELRAAGPGRTAAEFTAAVAAGVGCLHLEASDEVAMVAAAARAAGRRQGVAVRVNLPGAAAGARLRMAAAQSRFGIDADQVPAVLRQIAARPELALRGLHSYAGTQQFDALAFVRGAEQLVAAANAWERELGLALDELHLGGGFGAPTFHGDPVFDLAAAGAGVRRLVAAADRPGRRWFVELGRYLTALAGVYLVQVVREKRSGGVRQVLVDGGLHHCAAACGIGSVVKRPPLLVAVADLQPSQRTAAAVGGPLCTPADQFGADVELPPLRPGDLLAVLAAGAYGLTYSPTGFLSHAAPAEVLVDGDVQVVRERGRPEDALRGQHW